MAKAIESIDNGQSTMRAAATRYGVPKSTLNDRIHGAQTRHDAHTHEQLLTDVQEEELAKWIIDLDTRHQPPSIPRCRIMALEILGASNDTRLIGRQWLLNFFKRHPECSTLIGDPHESARVNEATEENVQGWFTFFLFQKEKFQVKDFNIYNMDEHGLCIGKINPRKVVGQTYNQWGRLRKRTRMRNSQNREWVSIIECISIEGSYIQPLIIFQGKNVNIDWTPYPPPPFKYISDPTAWINDEIAIWWLNEIFLP